MENIQQNILQLSDVFLGKKKLYFSSGSKKLLGLFKGSSNHCPWIQRFFLTILQIRTSGVLNQNLEGEGVVGQQMFLKKIIVGVRRVIRQK